MDWNDPDSWQPDYPGKLFLPHAICRWASEAAKPLSIPFVVQNPGSLPKFVEQATERQRIYALQTAPDHRDIFTKIKERPSGLNFDDFRWDAAPIWDRAYQIVEDNRQRFEAFNQTTRQVARAVASGKVRAYVAIEGTDKFRLLSATDWLGLSSEFWLTCRFDDAWVYLDLRDIERCFIADPNASTVEGLDAATQNLPKKIGGDELLELCHDISKRLVKKWEAAGRTNEWRVTREEFHELCAWEYADAVTTSTRVAYDDFAPHEWRTTGRVRRSRSLQEIAEFLGILAQK